MFCLFNSRHVKVQCQPIAEVKVFYTVKTCALTIQKSLTDIANDFSKEFPTQNSTNYKIK